jgi:hypothetical protein
VEGGNRGQTLNHASGSSAVSSTVSTSVVLELTNIQVHSGTRPVRATHP